MEPERETVVDAQADFEGRLTGQHARILGRFRGEIELSGRLTLGEGCRVEAKVAAESAEVAGSFTGDIKVKSLLLHEKARVQGTIDTQSLGVRDGAQVNGAVSAGAPRPKPAVVAAPRPATGAVAG